MPFRVLPSVVLPSFVSAAHTPRQLLQEADDGLSTPSNASSPSSNKAAPAATVSAASSSKLRASSGIDDAEPAKLCQWRGGGAPGMRASADDPAKLQWQEGVALGMRASDDACLGSMLGDTATHAIAPRAQEGSVCGAAAAAATAAPPTSREGSGVSKSSDSGGADRPITVGEGDRTSSFGPLPLQKVWRAVHAQVVETCEVGCARAYIDRVSCALSGEPIQATGCVFDTLMACMEIFFRRPQHDA
eukprot:111199-Pelagomonas_calceolata.AAC.2